MLISNTSGEIEVNIKTIYKLLLTFSVFVIFNILGVIFNYNTSYAATPANINCPEATVTNQLFIDLVALTCELSPPTNYDIIVQNDIENFPPEVDIIYDPLALGRVTLNDTTITGGTGGVGDVTNDNSQSFAVRCEPIPGCTIVTTAQVNGEPLSFTLINDSGDGNRNINGFIINTVRIEPEIALQRPAGNTIANGGTDDQGGGATAGTQINLTYTVANTGTDTLTLTSPATSAAESNVTVDAISAMGTTSVAPGGSTIFSVAYTPTLAGAYSFGLTVDSDDPNTPSYTITVSGTASGEPVIALQRPAGNTIANGGTDAQGGGATAGTQINLTYTVANSGTDTLTLTSPATSSAESNVTVDAISAMGTTSVAPGGSTTFSVAYTPTLAGAYSFGLTVVSNDPATPSYTITVSGTASGAPVIALQRPAGNTIANGGTDAQGGGATAGTQINLTYTVANTGTDTLTLTSPATSAAESNVTVDAISAMGTTSVAPGGSTIFSVAYTPTLAGAYSFGLTVDSDDPNTPSYTITVSGTASGEPVVSLQRPAGNTIANGGTDDQGGSATAGTQINLTYTVANSGTDTLTLTSPATSSAESNVTVDAISAMGTTSVASGGSTSFSVAYTPTLAGAYSFGLTVVSDDPATPSYTITVSGTASGESEIALQRPAGNTIANGGTDAQGGGATAGTQTNLTYTVANTGTDTLTLTSPATSSAESNVTVDAISAMGTTSVAPGGSTIFSVAYTPTLAGAYSFGLTVVSDDPATPSYTITVSGTASGAPVIALQRPAGNTIANGGTDAQGGGATAGTQINLTYTVANSGTDTLTLTSPATSSAESNVTVDSISAMGTTSVAPGGSTIFSVAYTPTLAGAYSFGLTVVSNDPATPSYTITVSGAASGEPVIVLERQDGTPISNGGTDPQGGSATAGAPITITYRVANNGTDTLTLPLQATVPSSNNVTINNIGPMGSTSVAPGGFTTFEVTYTPQHGPYEFDLEVTSNDPNTGVYAFTVSGSASAVSAINIISGGDQSTVIRTMFSDLIVAEILDAAGNPVVGVSVTFTSPENGASLVFQTTGTNVETVTTDQNGEARSSIMTANAIPSKYLGSGNFAPYQVTVNGANLPASSLSMTNTRDSAADIEKTKRAIAAFVTNRANSIVQEQPDHVARLRNGPFGKQRNLNSVNYNIEGDRLLATFQLSFQAFRNKISDREGISGQNKMELGLRNTISVLDDVNVEFDEENAGKLYDKRVKSGYDAWAQGTFAKTKDGDYSILTGLLFAGAEYRYKDKAAIGLMAQLDIANHRDHTTGTGADGVGWMFGPYGVFQPYEGLYIDVQATYGQSSNNINALGIFEDSFKTERLMLRGGVTGSFDIDNVSINPFTRITYFTEKQYSYVDELGNRIPSQNFNLGRIEFGPKISVNHRTEGGIKVSPFFSLIGIYDFNRLQANTLVDPVYISPDQYFRARIEGGLYITNPDRDIVFDLNAFFDGIGSGDFNTYGGDIRLTVPF